MAGMVLHKWVRLTGVPLNSVLVGQSSCPSQVVQIRTDLRGCKVFRVELSSLGSRCVHLFCGPRLRDSRILSAGTSGSVRGLRGFRGVLCEAMMVPAVHQAWVYEQKGKMAEVVKLKEMPVPEVAPGQVLIKVKAAGINPLDFKRAQGYLGDSDAPLPIVPGYDCAGVVVKLGSGVSKFEVNDEVYGLIVENPPIKPKQWGTLAAYTACEEKLLAHKPKNLTFEEAGCLPLAILTAYQGLKRAACGEGMSVLVLGGAGGVGTLIIQIAKHVMKAAHVVATGSARKADFLKGLGADKVIDYHTEDYSQEPERYDIVFDTVGEGPTKGVKVVKEGGTLISIMTRDMAYRHVVVSKAEDLEALNPYLESGVLKPIIDSKGKFKFSEVVQAFEYLETGRATGKVVISGFE